MSGYLYIRSHPEREWDACHIRYSGIHDFNLSNV